MEISGVFWNFPAADLVLRGPDAFSFLQGQFTNDLRVPAGESAVYGLFLNHKGRVLADAFVVPESGTEFRLISTQTPAQTIREHLEAFIVADDVEITEAATGSTLDVVVGRAGLNLLSVLGLARPTPGRCARSHGAIAFNARITGGGDAWHVYSPSDRGARRLLAEAVQTGGIRSLSAEGVTAARVARGVPAIPVDLGPDDLPNEGGLEHEAISFSKGCFLGQEVMARVKNLGQVRRRLHVIRTAVESTGVSAGMSLASGDHTVGTVRSLATDARGTVALAMLQTHVVRPGQRLTLEHDRRVEFDVLSIAEGKAW